VNSDNIQRKSDMAGKSKCLPKSIAVLIIANGMERCNITISCRPHHSQSCAALETDTSHSVEPSSPGGSHLSVRSDQLPNRLLDDSSLATNLSQSTVSPPTIRSTNDIPGSCSLFLWLPLMSAEMLFKEEES